MYKVGIVLSLILLIIFPVYAAIDVRLQGSIDIEIASEPSNDFRAGNRIKLYSELVNSGSSRVKLRLIGFNQKYENFNSYDASSWKQLDNIVDWAEVELIGNLIPLVPAKLSIGNVEIDYSPYTIYIVDDLLSDYPSMYSNHRGIALKDLELFGFDSSSFVLWGFENNFNKNIVGGRVKREFGNTKISSVFLDYGYRNPEAHSQIINQLLDHPDIDSELEWEKVTSFEVEHDLKRVGSIRYLIALLKQSTFEREGLEIKNNQALKILKEIELQKKLDARTELTIGYRDFPSDFNPLFRNRTPEFDPATGHYLGYNPIDRYNDRVGFYTIMTMKADQYRLKAELANMQNHGLVRDRFTRAELSFLGNIGVWGVDLFSRYDQSNLLLDTRIYNSISEEFTRLILTKQVKLGAIPFMIGFELRRQGNFLEKNQQGTPFVRYFKDDLINIEVGVRQTIKGKMLGGYYCGLNYKAPNGMELKYRYSTPLIVGDGKKSYDPDYREFDVGNIVQLSVRIEF